MIQDERAFTILFFLRFFFSPFFPFLFFLHSRKENLRYDGDARRRRRDARIDLYSVNEENIQGDSVILF